MKQNRFSRLVVVANLLWPVCAQTTPNTLLDHDLSCAASSAPIEATCDSEAPHAAHHSQQSGATPDALNAQLDFLRAAGFHSDSLGEIARHYNVINEENVAHLVALCKDVVYLPSLFQAIEEVNDERLALIAGAGFEPQARSWALGASQITAQNVEDYVRLFKDVINYSQFLSAAQGVSDDRLALIAGAGFSSSTIRALALGAEQITPANVHHYVALCKGAWQYTEILKAAEGVPDERLALVAGAGFAPRARLLALGAPQITTHNVHHYVALCKGVDFPGDIFKATKDVSDERLALVAGAGFEPQARSWALGALQITQINAKDYAGLLGCVFDFKVLLKAAKDVSDERLAFITRAGFDPRSRALALGAEQITAQNADDYALLLGGVVDFEVLLKEAKDVSGERLAFIARAGFGPECRVWALGASQITAQNVVDYALLCKDATYPDQLIRATKDVPDHRIAFIAKAGFDGCSRACALGAPQITAQNASHYARILKGAWQHAELLETCKNVSDERLALIAKAGFGPWSRVLALGAEQITAKNVDDYATLSKGVEGPKYPEKLLEAGRSVSDERLSLIARAGFDPYARSKVLLAEQITAQNAADYAALSKGINAICLLLDAARGVCDEKLADVAKADLAPMERLGELKFYNMRRIMSKLIVTLVRVKDPDKTALG